MLLNDFLYKSNFPDLTQDGLAAAETITKTMFSGVASLWHNLPPDQAEAKRGLCYSLLIAWYLLDADPAGASGVMGNGGMTLSSKSIGGTSLSFQDVNAQDGLRQLNSNMFGQKALMMIQGAPERFGIYA